MRLMVVDDEKNILEYMTERVTEAAPLAEVVSFEFSRDALSYAQDHLIDVAFLDIKMRGMDGLELGKRLKLLHPAINVIFCTGYDEYVERAINEVHCYGYLRKPIKTADIEEQLSSLHIPIAERSVWNQGLFIQCFGNFEVFYDGTPVKFQHGKTKEFLAYLIDHHGAVVTRGEMMAALWEDDKEHPSYYKKLKKDLVDTVDRLGQPEIIRCEWNKLSVNVAAVNCDYYQWWDGKAEGVKAFSGGYMDQYPWAEVTKGSLFQQM